MDTKLKNNRNKRILYTAIVILALSVINFCFFHLIYASAEKEVEGTEQYYSDINEDTLENLYQGCYVLYLEQKQLTQPAGYSAADLFLVCDGEDYEGAGYEIDVMLENWSEEFESYRFLMDYYVTDGENEKKNTDREIEEVLADSPDKEMMHELGEYYMYYFVISFDENGVMELTVQDGGELSADMLMKSFELIDRNCSLQDMMYAYTNASADRIRSFTVVYGVPFSSSDEMSFTYDYFGYESEMAIADRAIWLFILTDIVLILLVAVMTNKKIWADITSYERKGKWYLAEIGIAGVCFSTPIFYQLMDLIDRYGRLEFGTVWQILTSGNVTNIVRAVWTLLAVFVLYCIVYAILYCFRPLFSLGLREYIRQYSFLYQIFPWIKRQWQKLKAEVTHIDFSNKTTKTILKIVILNFVVLAILMCMWMFGIFGLVIYSVILFYLLKKYCDKIAKNYQTLMNATSRIANGDLDTIIMEDIGVFEPFKVELWKIRSGFKKALEEETKSQRMKTELITNVSHDLKTPLTAITTYVELLKKEDITEEERRSYIDTLDKKSLRLKVLIEDLFEVSKASSNNITLNMMDVDVVNLMKQVSIEHTDKYEAAGMELRWNVPEEKVILSLDNQKTYRIFENLFVNIQKYAMPNSRVYIDVTANDADVTITMKNMSAFELNVRPEELTERFVRGDASRNTEGSGLGLAIARSFTEAQNGSFEVAVDGDLFKTTIVWKRTSVSAN